MPYMTFFSNQVIMISDYKNYINYQNSFIFVLYIVYRVLTVGLPAILTNLR